MSIRLNWEMEEEMDVVNIYKSRYPLDLNNLSNPLVSFTNNESTFLDTTVEDNTIYHYAIQKVRGNDILVTTHLTDCYLPNPGRGPFKLTKVVDKEHENPIGILGRILPEDFYTSDQLMKVISKATKNRDERFYNLATPIADPRWVKYIFKGIVSYIPLNGLANLTTVMKFKDYYEAGLVYGIDGVGYVPEDAQPTSQDLTIELDGVTYRVRFIRMTNSPPGTLLDTKVYNEEDEYTGFRPYNDEDLEDSEYVRIFSRFSFTNKGEDQLDRIMSIGNVFTGKQRVLAAEVTNRHPEQIEYVNTLFKDNNNLLNIDQFLSTTTNFVTTFMPVLEVVD